MDTNERLTKAKTTLTLSPEVQRLLDELSRDAGVSRSAVVERAVRELAEKEEVELGELDADWITIEGVGQVVKTFRKNMDNQDLSIEDATEVAKDLTARYKSIRRTRTRGVTLYSKDWFIKMYSQDKVYSRTK